MQRYRVNYVLLVGLLVGTVVAAGSIYGIWNWQMTSNAASLLERANAAEESGDLSEAAELLGDYLAFRPNDEEVRIRQAELYLDIGQKALDEGDDRLFVFAKDTIINALFKFPNEDQLRADLVDLLIESRYRQFFAKDVLGHVKVLLAKNPDDPELLAKQANCLVMMGEHTEAAEVLYKLVGYDPAADVFNANQAVAPHDIDSYRMLSRILVGRMERKELARRLQDYMIETNPDSPEAYLERGSFFTSIDQGEGSRNDYGEEASEALQKAYELDPEKPETLLALAIEAQRNKDFDLTREYLEKGLELGSDNRIFYSGLGRLERAKGDYEAAITQIERGLQAVDENQKPWLLLDKIDFQIDAKNLAGAEETIKQLEREVGRKLPQIEFYEARMMADREQWLQAARALEDVRPKLAGDDEMRLELDALLGMAYEKNGFHEKALEVYRQIARQYPNNDYARIKVAQLERGRGAESSSQNAGFDFAARLKEEIEKPEAEQDWVAFDKFLQEFSDMQGRNEVQRKLLQAEVLVRRKKYEEAEQRVREAYEAAPEDLSVQRSVVKLTAANPNRGPETAMKLLDRTVKDFGDQWLLRVDRADLYLRMNRETLAEDLLSVTEGIGDWDVSKQVQLWKEIATRLNRAGKREEAERAWQRAAELNPGDLPTLMQVFEMALVRNDDEAMREAQQKVLDLVGSKDDANWAFTEAARKLVQYRQDPSQEKLPEEIRALIDTALQQRPEWHAPYILRASLAMLDRNYLDAIKDYKQGLSLGRGNPQAVSQYVRLLAAQGNFGEALEMLDRYDPTVNVLLIGRLYPQILFRAGRFHDAVEAADRISEAGEGKSNDQLWYGQFLQAMATVGQVPEDLREECLEKAGTALKNAVELAPENPATWLAQITHLLATGNRSDAELAIREAQLQLDEDQQPLLLARCYDLLGRWFDAENIYRNAYEQNPESDQVARQLASFYLGRRYPRPDGKQKASVLINDILRQHAEDPESVSGDNANWARRAAAELLAESGDYQNLLKAEKLLASNAVNGTLATEDKTQMASILASRPEPISRAKATKLLEEVASQQRLTPELDLTLGRLYFASGNWPKCRDHMATVLTRYPQAFAVRDSYIRMLLQRGGATDLRMAEAQLRELIKIAPQSPQTLELVSLVYDKMGQDDKAKQALQRMLPSDLNNLDENGVRLVSRVAQLMTSVGDVERAEKLYATLAKRPEATKADALRLAQFIGMHRDPARAFEMLETLSSDVPLTAVVDSGLKIVRRKRDEVGETYDAQIEGWLESARRDDPGAVDVMLLTAEFRDLQGSYEQAAKTYRQLLSESKLTGRAKAVVLNNLAYMLALGAVEESDKNEALSLIQEAADILGPIADVLDTRAVIWINRGEYQAAVDDLELAVTDSPTDSKYFHKAQAHAGLGQNSEALAAWQKAEDLGLSRESVNRLEHEAYDKLAEKMQSLKRRSNNL